MNESRQHVPEASRSSKVDEQAAEGATSDEETQVEAVTAERAKDCAAPVTYVLLCFAVY